MQSKFMFSTDKALALRQAAEGNKLAKIREILADPSFKAINACGSKTLQTALHRACHKKHAECALYLAINGADIESSDADKKTPIMYCEENGLDDLAKELKLIYALRNTMVELKKWVKQLWQEGTNRDKEVSKAASDYSDNTSKEMISKLQHKQTSPAIHAAEQRSWTIDKMLNYIDLTINLHSIPTSRFETMAGFFLLDDLIKNQFDNNININILEYWTHQKDHVFILIIDQQRTDSSYMGHKLLDDKKSIIFDLQINKIYFANDRPKGSAIENYNDGHLLNTFISNKCPYFLKLSSGQQNKYQQLWEDASAKVMEFIQPSSSLNFEKK